LFVWSAQWIQRHPTDFYGGEVNWWVSAVPMWVANWNPPLLAYLFAGVAALFGWSEAVLHLTGLLIAFAAGAGIYALAQKWCGRPLLATVIALLTPAFLVSASTLMCDVLMLAVWIWALVLWERALAGGPARRLFLAAGTLAGLAVLTKYSAVTLLPLLPLLSLLRTRRAGWWLLGLAVPLLMVAGYEWLTYEMYGRGLMSLSSYHARTFRPGFPGGWRAKGVIGLAFAGGSLLPVLLFAPRLWRPKLLLAGGLLIAAGALGLFLFWDSLGLSAESARLKQWGYVAQVALLAAGGVHLLLLTAAEARCGRSLVSLMLLVWIAGVLFFAISVNWLINARSFLPLAPAAAILLVRRLEAMHGARAGGVGDLWPLIPSAVVAVSLVYSDTQAADAERRAAKQIVTRYEAEGHQIWFAGHGAFQYYMQQTGGRPMDATSSELEPGDLAVMPMVTYGITGLPAGSVGWLGFVSAKPAGWLNLAGSTPHGAAGFYGANWGPVPFALGGMPGGTYFVVRVCSELRMDSEIVHPPGEPPGEVPSVPKISFYEPHPLVLPCRPEAAALIEQAKQSVTAGNLEEAIRRYRQALNADPKAPEALDQLAWLLATSPRPELRQGAEAVTLATRAVQLTDWRSAALIATLAAAYAETGRFDQAVETSRNAYSLAHVTGQDEAARQYAEQYRRYLAAKTVAAKGR
jgi:hypothetical protein